jgi:hypothetical protein
MEGRRMNTLFARKEPTTETLPRGAGQTARKMDTVLYKDAQASEAAMRIPWHFNRSTPTKKQRTVFFNCHRYLLAWLPPLEPQRSST